MRIFDLYEWWLPIFRGKGSRNGLEKDIQDKLASCRSRTETNELSAVVTYDKPQLTRYPWGAGITQRATHKFLGEGKIPNEIVYECFYHGLIIDKSSIKLLKFSASGVSAPQEANAWAVMAAEKAAKIFVFDL
ncbi:MAG: hypothetical protein ACM3YE_09055 [Bacteroidota bacterium]